MDYDVLVIGGGIAGLEAAINLGDMGYHVLLVEKEPSIGGKMILLSKVFPSLDCASCISTPKMALAASHENIKLQIYSEVKNIRRHGTNGFQAMIIQKPTFVDFTKCTGCQDCEKVCTVTVPDQFNFDLISRRAAYIAFPQAVPKKAVIDRVGTSPCTFACPAGIKANGYISLIRQGEFEKAFNLVLEDTPLVGSLGRACYAPCQNECTRETIGNAPHIKLLKRFVADWYYAKYLEPQYGPPETKLYQKVAIVGSGPAGLSAAYFLAKKGYPVTVFESANEAGGMLRSSLPVYRLPKDVVERDILNVTVLGVAIRTATRIDSLNHLRHQGFDAVFVSLGAPAPKKLGIENEGHPDVMSGIDLLSMINRKIKVDLAGKSVLVVGGGNVAIDVARTARRLGCREVRLMCLEKKEEMPATHEEIHDASAEGVKIHNSLGPKRIVVKAGRLFGMETIQCTAVFNTDRKFAPQFKPNSEKILAADKIFVAIGQESLTAHLADEGIELNRNKTIKVNAATLMTSIEGIFAGGETVLGPAIIVEAIGQGKRAAFYIDRWLQGQSLAGDEYPEPLPQVDKESVLARQSAYPSQPVEKKELHPEERIQDFSEVEMQLNEEEALASAANCLNCGICSECQQCRIVCPAAAVDLAMRPKEKEITAFAVVVATGFRFFPGELMERYGYGRFKNVISAMQMDRLVAPTRPFNHILRPGDGKVPNNIAYVLCAGSRDRTVGTPICSRVCCMASLKQAQLLLGALPVADVTIYNIDIRAFGKGYDEFYEQTRAMGVRFVRGKIAKISEKENHNLLVRYENMEGSSAVLEAEHDLVVLSVGIVPNPEFANLFAGESLQADEISFVNEPGECLNPAQTSIDGVFVAGTATGPLDIPDTILHSGAAAAQTAAYIEMSKNKP